MLVKVPFLVLVLILHSVDSLLLSHSNLQPIFCWRVYTEIPKCLRCVLFLISDEKKMWLTRLAFCQVKTCPAKWPAYRQKLFADLWYGMDIFWNHPLYNCFKDRERDHCLCSLCVTFLIDNHKILFPGLHQISFRIKWTQLGICRIKLISLQIILQSSFLRCSPIMNSNELAFCCNISDMMYMYTLGAEDSACISMR